VVVGERPGRSLARRLLAHVALGAVGVLAVVAAVAYAWVYRQAGRRVADDLDTYVGERSRREEVEFRVAYSNLLTVRSLFLGRDGQPPPADVRSRWDARVRRDPDGGWRSSIEEGDPSLWGHRDLEPTPRQMFRMLNALDLTGELMAAWEESFPSIYMSFPGSACIGFNPLQPLWVWETPSDYPLEDQEWFAAATPAQNPSGGFVWTGIYPDPISGLPFATVMLPVVAADGEYICTLAHDMHMDRLLDRVAESGFAGATESIWRGDGRIVAHADLREQILSTGGALTAQGTGDPALTNLYQAVSDGRLSGFEPGGRNYYSARRLDLPGADWFFVATLPRSVVRAEALRSAQWVWVSGLVSLGLLLAALAGILRRQVSRPVARLLGATRAMAAGAPHPPPADDTRDELGALAASFATMADRVAAREGELRELNTQLERRVAARTAELEDANRRLGESLRAEKEAGELRANFVALVSHEFRTPLEVILTSSDILSRYFDRLEPEKRSGYLATIHDSVKRMAGMMEEVLLLGKVEAGRLQFRPEPLDLPALCESLVGETLSATARKCPVSLACQGDLSGARGDEPLLRHVISNLLSNAVKFSPPGAPVTLTVSRRGADAVVEVADRGRGIPAADRGRLFRSFQRGSNVRDTPGTGLGLMIAGKCVEIHGGAIGFESSEGAGTTFRVALPLFAEPLAAAGPLPVAAAATRRSR
jgi:signal transduction histidine kinase